jgi:hypothetical protein
MKNNRPGPEQIIRKLREAGARDADREEGPYRTALERGPGQQLAPNDLGRLCAAGENHPRHDDQEGHESRGRRTRRVGR